MTDTTEKLEANKKLARDYIDQVFNQHNPDKAPDFVTGDLYAAERDIIAENDLVVVRLVVTATVKGSLLGAPADGKPGPVGRGGHLPGHRRQDQRGVGRRRRRGDHGPDRCLPADVTRLRSEYFTSEDQATRQAVT